VLAQGISDCKTGGGGGGATRPLPKEGARRNCKAWVRYLLTSGVFFNIMKNPVFYGCCVMFFNVWNIVIAENLARCVKLDQPSWEIAFANNIFK